VAHDAADSRLAIGTVALADRGSGAHALPAVHWLAVLPPWRRRGVARLLMATLEHRCWKQGHDEIFLETHEGWTAARQLYEVLGYRPVR
jgi:GNAT superfamily N-acetyltransferase